MTKILERISVLAENEGVKITELERLIGASRGVLSRAINKNTDIQSKWLEKIVENFPNYSSEWILKGEQPMLKSVLKVDKGHNEDKQSIPLIAGEAFAGIVNSISLLDYDVSERYIVPEFKHVDFMIRVKGSSMYPKYSSGDVVACKLINNSAFIQWNKVHVIATKEQGIVIKRLKKSPNKESYIAVSDNKDYDPFEIPQREILNIALVVGVIRLE